MLMMNDNDYKVGGNDDDNYDVDDVDGVDVDRVVTTW